MRKRQPSRPLWSRFAASCHKLKVSMLRCLPQTLGTWSRSPRPPWTSRCTKTPRSGQLWPCWTSARRKRWPLE
eukprot:6547550-Pyramimonas_sp.AAC.1